MLYGHDVRTMLKAERVQAIDMECATLFTVGYSRKVPVGALMLISDLPFRKEGIKTKENAKKIFEEYMETHVDLGISTLKNIREKKKKKNYYFFGG